MFHCDNMRSGSLLCLLVEKVDLGRLVKNRPWGTAVRC